MLSRPTLLAARAGRNPALRCLARSAFLALASFCLPSHGSAIGDSSWFDVRIVEYTGGGTGRSRESSAKRIAWEIRKRTSIETRLEPSRARLSDASIFSTPFLYWSGERGFDRLSEAEIVGLRRFVEFGGFVLIDNNSPDTSGFDESIRRELSRAFPKSPLGRLAPTHTMFRAFYLLDRPVGRIEGPPHFEAIERAGRIAVLYSRHDLGGAWARDNLGNWQFAVTPGGEAQRELAIRLGVNIAMYALCLDYKDDQVHAPFIMRRRGSGP